MDAPSHGLGPGPRPGYTRSLSRTRNRIDRTMDATSIRKGSFIMHKGGLWQVIDTTHRTPGNKRGFVQMKIKNMANGTHVVEKFSSNEIDDAFREFKIDGGMIDGEHLKSLMVAKKDEE